MIKSNLCMMIRGIADCFQTLTSFSGDVSNAPTQILDVRISISLPRVLGKSDRADDDLVYSLIAEAGVLKDQHVSINACEDVASLFGIDQHDSLRDVLIAFPEQSCSLSLPTGEGS